MEKNNESIVDIEMNQKDLVSPVSLDKVPPVSLDSVSLDSVALESVALESVALEKVPPVSLESASLDSVALEKASIFSDQDFQQKMGVTITVVLELYRVLIASFLILFVPQTCGDHICSIEENAQTGSDPLYNAGFSFNCITLIAFIAMYFAEIKREGKLISYLDVNPKCKTDNDSVGQVLEKLPEQRRNIILFYDNLYQKTGYFALTCFSINSILSGFVVYKYYLDDKTTSTFITSVLFMITKMADVYATVNTEKNIFYSAYLKGKIQYNDLDANKKPI
jgi:hypothetical protein